MYRRCQQASTSITLYTLVSPSIEPITWPLYVIREKLAKLAVPIANRLPTLRADLGVFFFVTLFLSL